MDLGNHIIAEVYDVPDYLTTNCDILERLLIKAAIDAKATVLHSYFHKFGMKDCDDPNGGVTGVVVLSESHISVHSWPEHQYMAIDIFMCGDSEPWKVIEALENEGLYNMNVKKFARGVYDEK